ncbi:hypothetical protein J2Z83_003753 [Virgibacillus natechei]|uniref:HNH endonuclease n=1 Tax=Virgibacillus natechei TaxID=1216297 RepID=A0ABS4IKV8_9BACI|nr:NUMOD4 motif-containing HNH endonuclease [Virgibacillus natechei]MBP1971602.1 hypothetical protein [Virgibacillus natechei]UZD13067.1 NUMOD4 motif-containing HNH endonuclease [Virgibacillus natechei]
MTELWRYVKGHEGEYMVSNKGRMLSFKDNDKPLILKTFFNHSGYVRVNLMKESKLKQVFVHRLVAESFLREFKEGYSVNHKDGNKANNIIKNLEMVTQKENVNHSLYVLGNGIKPVLMLDKDSFVPIREFDNVEVAGRETGIDSVRIWRVCNWERNFVSGYSWMYKDEYSEECIEKRKNNVNKGFGRKRVYQIDPKTNIAINAFEGVGIAERELGLSNIRHCVAGLGKTAGGYKWSYQNPHIKG